MIELDVHKKLNTAEGEMDLHFKSVVKSRALTTIYGTSGAGKTSVLRMLAGLLSPDSGKIIVNESTWFDSSSRTNLPPQERKVGFVFQDYALFPNMTVRENLEYALASKNETKVIDELIDLIELGGLEKRKPDTLSGGQKQRVALARAIVRKPQVLMLDEPLSALDQSMRSKLQDYILQLHKEYNLTTLLVSHEMGEVFKLSDEVIVLENGSVRQQGLPAELFTSRQVSGKFQFTGEILNIQKEDIIYIISVLIGNSLVKVAADEREVAKLAVGDKVLVASKAFNPIIQKIG
ncbi:MAG: ATP-binding cassette domain-containing protein [Cyclobacteriaceae bacterium]|nr:ATP-binding cassette domain-containing protein [Cyclobacteriaceae bacterium]